MEVTTESVIQAEEISTKTSTKEQVLTVIPIKRLWQECYKKVMVEIGIARKVMERGHTQ